MSPRGGALNQPILGVQSYTVPTALAEEVTWP